MLHHFITHVGLLHGQETEVGVFSNGVVRKKRAKKYRAKKETRVVKTLF